MVGTKCTKQKTLFRAQCFVLFFFHFASNSIFSSSVFQTIIKLWTILENYHIRTEHFAAVNYAHKYFVNTLSKNWKSMVSLCLHQKKEIKHQREIQDTVCIEYAVLPAFWLWVSYFNSAVVLFSWRKKNRLCLNWMQDKLLYMIQIPMKI